MWRSERSLPSRMLRSVAGVPRVTHEFCSSVAKARTLPLFEGQSSSSSCCFSSSFSPPFLSAKVAARTSLLERWCCLYSAAPREGDISSCPRVLFSGVDGVSVSTFGVSVFLSGVVDFGLWSGVRGRRALSSYYSPRAIRCRNRPPPILLQTGEPPGEGVCESSGWLSAEALSSRAPYTLAKQERLLQQQQVGEGGRQWSLFRGRVVRQLSVRRVKQGGRNATGQITVRHQGGGHAQRLRLVDFRRSRKDIWSTVLRVEYDPCHSSGVALVQYDDGVLSYIPAAAGMRPGDRVVSALNAPIVPGCSMPLASVPVGSILHAIELRPGTGAQLARAAGAYATLVSKDASLATLRLPSGELRALPLKCWASIGQAMQPRGGGAKKPPPLGKAGASRWRGVRPSVRGKAMNACKHPHGGGTSQKKIGRCPVSAWGILRNGFKTRAKAKPLDLIVRRRRSAKFMRLFGGNS